MNAPTAAETTVSADLLREQLTTILEAWGMSAETIPPTVDIMVETDLRGIDSHGIAMLPLYAEMRRRGKIAMRPVIEVVRESPVTALIDGGGGLGHAPSADAMRLAIQKAKAAGLAAVTVRNSNHFGAAGAYAMMATAEGLIGIAMTNAGGRSIVPTRAREPVFGTNPIAFAAPTRDNLPFVLDMATSTVAVGKVKLAAYAGKPLPSGWVVDADGVEVTVAADAFDGTGRLARGFGMTPLGGLADLSSHKGYGLAAMVEVLCGMLPGAPFIAAMVEPAKHQTGHFFLALDPNAFRDEGEFQDELDAMIDHLRALEPTDPELPVLVHGDPENIAREERLADGIPIPGMLADALADICRQANVEYLLDQGR
ncbi:MAG: Ldh family oxidoreductase [Alphaproteobacteria bacterium]|jgi:LDH2 family malate/lactate/ureidoglycolate dehydrogenase|nr:Ldh family oxidoreductase [Alphaproteobacteria bacterium]MDP6566951.1 Ldh family oxidoreductase [Alphaproteobacteria bacterium]MDP6813751.1 Ldh family oxidoreductase [Alphaproteobacteria bacterium]